MDAMIFAAMQLTEHRFAELERENRRRVQHAERHAAVAAAAAGRAAEAERVNLAHLALAGPAR